MTTWKRWIRRGVLCGLVIAGLVAFSTFTSAADKKPAINDHAAMAAWYDKEAANLRQHEKDMEAMAEEYKKNPGLDDHGVMSPKIDMVQHCQSLTIYYAKGAEEAEFMAKAHRGMVK